MHAVLICFHVISLQLPFSHENGHVGWRTKASTFMSCVYWCLRGRYVIVVRTTDVPFMTHFNAEVGNTLHPPLERNPGTKQLVSIGEKSTVFRGMCMEIVRVKIRSRTAVTSSRDFM